MFTNLHLIKGCKSLTNIANAVMQVTSGVAGNWSYTSSVTYICDTGYYLSPDLTLVCSSDGSWNSILPACELVTCSTPITPDNGLYLPENIMYNFTEMVYFSCFIGFDLIGTSSSECNATGQWSESSPVCQIKDCGHLTNPAHGHVWHTDGTTFGQTAYYNCSEGSTLNGTTIRTCNESGMWTSESPTCDVISKFIMIDYVYRITMKHNYYIVCKNNWRQFLQTMHF